MSEVYKGSCLCGEVAFEVNGFSLQAANCHCTMCRKFHGAAFGTLVGVSGLHWTSGKSSLKEYTAHNGSIRTFCSSCGSSLGFRVKGALLSSIEIAISVFDDPIPVKVDAQIFTNYKANWCVLQDDLPTFGEGRSNQ